MFAFLQCLLNICIKLKFLISQGRVATCLRCGGYCCMGFVANFIRFRAVQKFWKLVKISQSCREFKGGNFFLRHSVVCIYIIHNNIRDLILMKLAPIVRYKDTVHSFWATAYCDLDLLTPKSNQHIYEPKYICDHYRVKFSSSVSETWCS